MNLSALTVQQLRYLLAIDKLRSFRDAAASCHVSQPALSAQVKKVEVLLGVCIFDRSRQPIMPTDRGTKIMVQARRALEQFDRIGLIATESEEIAGSYRLGVIPTLSSTFLPLLVPPFVQRYPRVSLEIVETKTEPMIRALREGALDAGLAATPLELPGVSEHTVCRETLYAYLPRGHRLCTQSSVRQADLLDEQVWLLAEGHCFRTQVLALCSVDRASRPEHLARVDIDAGSFETLVGFVDAGLGVTVLPELFVRRLSEAQRA
jgi:LysR family hydrogen peroxide-inducible transcriptional activator